MVFIGFLREKIKDIIFYVKTIQMKCQTLFSLKKKKKKKNAKNK